MDQAKKIKWRGIPPSQQQHWMNSIEQEQKLRLKWFKKNETRLAEMANQSPLREVPQELKSELKRRMRNCLQQRGEPPNPASDEPPLVDEGAILGIMRPVDREVRAVLYKSTMQEGRKKYLEERYKLLPEQRYYFPETTSFKYGWKLWDLSKNIKASEFARQQVIKHSFYRRRGTTRDPDWYKDPSRISPLVCGKI